jgi:hypothetical protein
MNNSNIYKKVGEFELDDIVVFYSLNSPPHRIIKIVGYGTHIQFFYLFGDGSRGSTGLIHKNSSREYLGSAFTPDPSEAPFFEYES